MEPRWNKKIITLVIENFSPKKIVNTKRGSIEKYKRLAGLGTESKGSENKLKIRKYRVNQQSQKIMYINSK